MTFQKRLKYYPLLLGLCVILPYLTTIVFIVITGSRTEGMQNAVLPSLFLVHVTFGLILIKKDILKKLILTILISSFTAGLVWTAISNGYYIEVIMSNYGYWDLALNNLLGGLIIWESYSQIEEIINKNTTRQQNLRKHGEKRTES